MSENMYAGDIFKRYLDEIVHDPTAWAQYPTNALWTPIATRALVAAEAESVAQRTSAAASANFVVVNM